jgi:hypothetical protein
MLVLARRIKHPLDVPVQGPHHADPREHGWPAMFRDQQQRLHCGKPFLGIMFCLGQFGDELAGVLQRDELATARQRDWIIERSFPALGGASREEIGALLREHQIAARRMHGGPAVRDSGFNRSAVFLIAAASISKLPVDDLDRQPPGMVGLNRIRQLKQFSLGGLGCPERAVCLEFHLGCMIAMPTPSACRRSPLGPRGILIHPSIIV